MTALISWIVFTAAVDCWITWRLNRRLDTLKDRLEDLSTRIQRIPKRPPVLFDNVFLKDTVRYDDPKTKALLDAAKAPATPESRLTTGED